MKRGGREREIKREREQKEERREREREGAERERGRKQEGITCRDGDRLTLFRSSHDCCGSTANADQKFSQRIRRTMS